MPFQINIKKSACGRSATSFLLGNFFWFWDLEIFLFVSAFFLLLFLEVGAC